MERDFKGIWIPKEVWMDDRLTALEKFILMEIDSLDNENGCFATNKYLADFCQCTERKVILAINKLKELGYVYVVSRNGNTRVLGTTLQKVQGEKSSGSGCKNFTLTMKKVHTENTNENTTEITNNYISVPQPKSTFSKPTLEEVLAYVIEKGYHFDAERFYYYYESVGWKVGKKPMKSWKAACVTWERNNRPSTNGGDAYGAEYR